MRACLLILASVLAYTSAQFVNGRQLEAPVPNLCAQRVIHDRTPDGKQNNYFYLTELFDHDGCYKFVGFCSKTKVSKKLMSQKYVFEKKEHISKREDTKRYSLLEENPENNLKV